MLRDMTGMDVTKSIMSELERSSVKAIHAKLRKAVPVAIGRSQSILGRDEYEAHKKLLQRRLSAALDGIGDKRWVFVFEGMDAAGKSSTIRKMMRDMDKHRVELQHMPAPGSPEEKRARKELSWYADLMPQPGKILFMDRSWYGNAIGRRVNEPSSSDWPSLFDSINRFESGLAKSGIGVAKFMLKLSAPEMKRRVHHRKTSPDKKHKYSENDERAVFKYRQNLDAMNDVLENTSTDEAPWYEIDMDDKWKGRIEVMELVASLMEGRQ